MVRQAPDLLLDVNGVGYEVQVPMTTFWELPQTGSEVQLHIHFSVSENSQRLYGFASEADRTVFRKLIKVSGLGPKTAVAVLSGLTGAQLAQAVREAKVSWLTGVPGIGKKTAERMIVELRDAFPEGEDINAESGSPEPPTSPGAGAEEAASEALQALGYSPRDADKMVAKVRAEQPEAGMEDLIRQALRSVAR